MTCALVPHRRLPTVIIDHPLEGDNHIYLGMDGHFVDIVVPRHILKSGVEFLEAHSLSGWTFTSAISCMERRGGTMNFPISGLGFISFSCLTKKKLYIICIYTCYCF